MNRSTRAALLALAALLLVAHPGSSAPLPGPRCVDPYPCGDEWPAGLSGPFVLDRVEHVQVASHDGVVLDGWLSFPALPRGVKAPVILMSTPYLATVMNHPAFGPFVMRHPASDLPVGGARDDSGNTGTWWDDTGAQPAFDKEINGLGVFPLHWIQRGFVLANFSLRGTGHSGGCIQDTGRSEQLDQARLVEWLAARPWSNGRVGMGGLSYPGATTWQAAVQAPKALKAIVGMSPIVDYYGFNFTPQGARILANDFVVAAIGPQYANPAVLGDPVLAAGALPARAGCAPTTARAPQARVGGYVTGNRDRAFYEERDLTPRLKDVKAAVLATQGYLDAGHFFQDRTLTASLPRRTPVREVKGWWYHQHPGEQIPFDPPGAERSWEELVTGWFEYWLKGVGPMPRLGTDHQDQLGAWHSSTRWPPPEAKPDTRYLAGGALAKAPNGSSTSFLSAPPLHETGFPSWALGLGVGGGQSLCTPQVGALYSLDVDQDTVLAGNPYADLRITSDGPAGLVGVTLYDVAPGFSCPSVLPTTSVTSLASGAADLQYYKTRYEPLDFPTGTPVRLRVDLTDVTAVVKKGHRLVAVVSHGEYGASLSQPGAYPTITVHPDSRLVLPTVR